MMVVCKDRHAISHYFEQFRLDEGGFRAPAIIGPEFFFSGLIE